jgi:hypothetical protein
MHHPKSEETYHPTREPPFLTFPSPIIVEGGCPMVPLDAVLAFFFLWLVSIPI